MDQASVVQANISSLYDIKYVIIKDKIEKIYFPFENTSMFWILIVSTAIYIILSIKGLFTNINN